MTDRTDPYQKWKEQYHPSEQELSEIKQERAEMEDTMSEWIQMQPNGDIAYHSSSQMKNGGHGTGSWIVTPQETEDYALAKSQYQLNVPGDTMLITSKLENGEWIVSNKELKNFKA